MYSRKLYLFDRCNRSYVAFALTIHRKLREGFIQYYYICLNLTMIVRIYFLFLKNINYISLQVLDYWASHDVEDGRIKVSNYKLASSKRSIHTSSKGCLRCGLTGFERDYKVKILSKQINKVRFYTSAVKEELIINPRFLTGFSDGSSSKALII